MSENSVTRRKFLRAAAGAGAAALAAPAIGAARDPSERLRFAVIGVGGANCGRGTDHLENLMRKSRDPKLNISVDMVCDIYDRHLENAKRIASRDRPQGQCAGVREWEKVAESPDIDCVVIATPDHWHAPMALACLRAGKDVYLEKPMTLTIEEAKEVHKTTVAEKRILQVGVQGTANGHLWGARELVAGGVLGKLLWGQTSYCRNSTDGEWNYPIHPDASPTNIVWDRFIGPAPKRPYSGERFFRWRKYWDYSGGIATDLHYHRLAALHVILGPEFPRRATAAGGVYVQKDGREVPDTFLSTVEYPSGHYIVMSSSMANDVGLPDIIRGHQATLFLSRGLEEDFQGGPVIRPQGLFRQEFVKAHGNEALPVEPKPRSEHMTNFIECARSRRSEDLNCSSRLGYQTMVGISMGVLAYRTGKTVEWDPERETTI